MEGTSGGAAESPDISTERKVFEAALVVFARKGRDGARMQEIADEAGINRALLHYYFRSKQQLYEAVFAHGFDLFLASFGESFQPNLPFADALRAFIEAYIDYAHDHPSMARLMVNECIREGSLVGQHMACAFESGSAPGQLMERRIEAAVEAGEIRPVDPEHTLLTIVSSCLFMYVALPTVRFLIPQAVDDFDGFVEARKQHVYDVLMRGLAPRDSNLDADPVAARTAGNGPGKVP